MQADLQTIWEAFLRNFISSFFQIIILTFSKEKYDFIVQQLFVNKSSF